MDHDPGDSPPVYHPSAGGYTRATRAAAGDMRRLLEHLPVRPSWSCAGCGEPWPCSAAQARLLAAYSQDRLMLSVHLAGHLIDAISDLPRGRPGELYSRFLGWTRGRRS